MKFKKSWIFWICYYAAAIIGNVLAAFLLRDKWNFNAWSAFPIIFTALSLFWLFYSSSKFYTNLMEEGRIQHHKRYHKYFDEERYRAKRRAYEQNEAVQKKDARDMKFYKGFMLLLIPFFWMYIFFFSNYAKAFSWIFPGIAFIVVGLWVILHDCSGETGTQQEKELKEQQEREELGKWK